MNKLWKKFDALSSECYTNMIQSNMDLSIWDNTFSILIEIIGDERSKNSNFAPELMDLEDSIDYQCDVSGWLEDYLDELDMYQKYDRIIAVCESLMKLFQWTQDSPSDLRFHIAAAMGSQGKNKEVLAFCEDWYKKENDNILAATSLIYARTAVKDFAGAGQIVDKYIDKDTACTDENDIVYTAAECLYKVSGDKKAEKRIKRDLKKYEEDLEKEFLTMDEEDLDFDIYDEDLPFN